MPPTTMTSFDLDRRTPGHAILNALAACILSAAAFQASADASDQTTYRASLYLWGAGIQGETARGTDIDVGFDTLIRNLNLAFMGAFEARRGTWSLGANGHLPQRRHRGRSDPPGG